MIKILFKITTLIIITCFSVLVNAQDVKYSGGNGDGYAQSSSYINIGVPGSFSAAAGVDVIQLTWQQNTDTNNVIIAYSTSNSFGTPVDGTPYSVNDNLSGGGTIIFNGSGTSYLHTGLSATTTYYYKAWSVSDTTYSSNSVTANATTQTLPAKYAGGNGDGYAQSSSFVNIGVPGSFSAGAGVSVIQLTWQQNTDTNNVIIAYNTSNSFGTPVNGNSYSVNDVLSVGGTIIFNDSATSYLHTGLSATTTYYYKAWSVSGTTYSSNAVTSSATTQTLPAKYAGGNGDGYASAAAGSGPLPVELTSFEAKNTEDKIKLTWETATEVNDHGFEVERITNDNSGDSSLVNVNWADVGFVKGAGNSNSSKDYSYTDRPTGGTEFSYRLKQIDNDGNFKYYDSITVKLNAKTKAELMNNYPNPFNPSTAIKFYLPGTEKVTIKIYDVLGKKVKTLFNRQTDAGYHIVYWNGRNSSGNSVASGVYIYRLSAVPSKSSGKTFVQTKKMLMLK